MFEGVLNLFSSLFEKPFKVGIISYYYPFRKATTSGVGTHVYNLVTHLSKLGCEVHVFTFSDKNQKDLKIKVGVGKIVLHFINPEFPYNVSDPVIGKRVRYTIFEDKVLNEVSIENFRRRFDIIHTHGWLTSSAFILKYLYRLPWVHTVHALERNRLPSMTTEEKKLFRLTSWIEETIVDSDKLIAVSESISKELVKAFGKVSKKIEVIPNGVDLKLFTPSQTSPKSVLSVTRFSKEKGIEMIPRIAYNILSKVKSSKFTIVAPQTEIPTLKPIQKEFVWLSEKYPKRFIWISNPLMPQDIALYYRAAGIYLQPSFYESFGLCILEGMASGSVIVATNVGGIPEVVDKSGILVNPKSEELSKAVIKLLRSDTLRNKYREKSLERVKSFDWPIVAKRTLDLYKEVVQKKKEIDFKSSESDKK